MSSAEFSGHYCREKHNFLLNRLYFYKQELKHLVIKVVNFTELLVFQ